MKKLSLDALKERAKATASTELLATINGGTENSCHNTIIAKQGDLIIYTRNQYEKIKFRNS